MALPFLVDTTWTNDPTYDASELRHADAALLAGSGTAIGALGGVVRHGDTSLAVTVDGSDVVTIQPGPFVIRGNAVVGTGPYRGALASAITGSLAARDATNARIDLVIVRQLDTDVVGTHGAKTGKFEILPGTPSATPAVPALPSMAEELGRITVPASGGGAATVDSSNRTYATAIGGVLAVTSFAKFPAATAVAKGQEAVALDTLVKYQSDGTTWIARTSIPGDFRTGSANTDASGFYTFTHTLGYTPSGAFFTLARATGALYTDICYDTVGSTTIRLRFLANGTPAASVTGIPFVALFAR